MTAISVLNVLASVNDLETKDVASNSTAAVAVFSLLILLAVVTATFNSPVVIRS